ncbi:MAG: fibronectin type III domain-containing protein [Gammaproteobacteria bacterium]|nr:fibronectin type III domain-containing protein [Gammaproteobacteria bacterium]
MKSILNILLIFSMGLLLSACGGSGSGDSGGEASGNQQLIDLSWRAPTTRTDGSPLDPSELEGYRVYYGTSPDDLVLREELLGISATEITLNISIPGTYYFAITAYDSNGLESAFSKVVSKEVG